ncbi:hypothetical protein FHL15_005608 [Xylaria flabelliformis]|uniref:Peptidase S1 domain-containing protein n=1 Tax=Xylaria flabelliformis TaxID=2512241 RepID=A0A553I0A1_9PEZI|nr:hypothetical protein FHL15_005608 [Xylaria flabelliformis]
MASSPYKPDNEERDSYFHGFSGSPKLVARTGHNRWTKSLFEYGWNSKLAQHRKHYMALDNPDIIGKWSKELSTSIITALGQCRWSYFFPIRTCLRDDLDHQEGVIATILLVAVEPASLQWEDGINIALSCRDIIRKFKIFDVEVEIMEGCYIQHAASTQLEAYFDRVNHADRETSEKILPLLSYTGYPIGYLEEKRGQGTVGLHIKLGADESTIYGLTCRHVVYNDRAAHEFYKPSADVRQYHIQANAATFDDILYRLESTVREQEAEVMCLRDPIKKWDEWYQYHNPRNILPPDESDRQRLAWKEESLAYNTSVVEILEKIVDRKQRQIGHLAFLPSFTISPRHRGYLRDWALVELDPNKFIRGPDNRVFLGPNEKFVPPDISSHENTLQLRSPNDEGNFKSYTVGKRGVATGLTFGKKSGIEAVVRRPGAGLDGDVYTWEFLIVPERGTKRFSDKGDSGSAIFDINGYVVGIVTASNGVADVTSTSEEVKLREETDITFAAPIKCVLDDIQDFTGQQPRLA